MVASKMAPQWPSLPGIHALVRLPPRMYQGWHVWLTERGRSAGVSLPKLGHRRHCHSALLPIRSCALKGASRVEYTQAALWRGFTGKDWCLLPTASPSLPATWGNPFGNRASSPSQALTRLQSRPTSQLQPHETPGPPLSLAVLNSWPTETVWDNTCLSF